MCSRKTLRPRHAVLTKGSTSMTVMKSSSSTTASKPNHSFLTFVALIVLSWSCQTFDSVWHNILIAPKGTLRYYELLDEAWWENDLIRYRWQRCLHWACCLCNAFRPPSSCLQTRLLCSYCKNNKITLQPPSVIAHLQRVKYYPRLCVW